MSDLDLKRRLETAVRPAYDTPIDVAADLVRGRQGRRRRRMRRVYAGTSACAVAAVVIGSLGAVVGGGPADSRSVVNQPQKTASADGMGDSERFDEVVDRHLQGIPFLTTPEQDHLPLLGTHGKYEGESWILMGIASSPGPQTLHIGMRRTGDHPPFPPKPNKADDEAYCADTHPLRCEVDGTVDTWTVTEERLDTLAGGERAYWLEVREWRDSGDFGTVARIGVAADSWAQARDLWLVDQSQLRAVVTDPILVMPPVRRVPNPKDVP
jgi:hypothetical protein